MPFASNDQCKPRPLAHAAACYLATFAVCALALAAAFALCGIYPFGDTSVMLYDMPLQYVDYFGWFSEVLRGEADLTYSNAAGMGGGTFALFTYYLSSPFNLLAYFWQPEDMPKLFSWLYLLKIPAGGLACLLFLRGRYLAPNAQSASEARAQIAAARPWKHLLLMAFAIAYALSGYVLGYASNIMWLDGVIMAPLAALACRRLVQGRGCAPLFLSCMAAVLFNWYAGYMVCLLAVVVFLYEIALDGTLSGKRARLCGRFAATMVLAAGASVVVLLPTALALLAGKGSQAGLSAVLASFSLAHNPLAVPSLFTIGTLPGVNPNNNTPAIAISALVGIGIGVFFANRGVTRREKITGGALVAVMGLSLIFPPWTTIWSGFVQESSYTNRNGFAILLAFIMAACQGMLALEKLPAEKRLRAAAMGGGTITGIYVVSEVLTWLAKGELRPSAEQVALEIGLLAAFTALLCAACATGAKATRKATADGEAQQARSARNRSLAYRSAMAALCLVFCLESVIGSKLQFDACCYTVDSYTQEVQGWNALYSQLPTDTRSGAATSSTDSADDEADSGGLTFTRVANTSAYWGSTKFHGSDNMALHLGFSTVDHYTSTQASNIQDLLANLGYTKLTPVGTYYQSPNPAADALLGFTDIVAATQPAGTTAEGALTARGEYRLWSNDLALPLGWGTQGSASVSWAEGEPFTNQEALIADACGSAEGVFATPEISEAEGTDELRTFTITPTTSGPVLLYLPTLYLLDFYLDAGITCDVSVNGTVVQTVGGRGSCNVVNLGQGEAGVPMTLTLKPRGPSSIASLTHADGTPANEQTAFWDVDASDLVQATSVNIEALSSALSNLDTQGFTLTRYDNGSIAATFTAKSDETLVLSQPYEAGWTAKVNGQSTPVRAAYDGLMAIDVSAGENDVELHYETPGLATGAAVSIACITIFGVWRAASRWRSMRKTAGVSSERASSSERS